MKFLGICVVAAGMLLSFCGCSKPEDASQTVGGTSFVDSSSLSTSTESSSQNAVAEDQSEGDLSSADISSADEPSESSAPSEPPTPPDNIQNDQIEPEISSMTDERLDEIDSIYLHQEFFLSERECTLTDKDDFQLVLSLTDDLTLSDVYGPVTGAGGIEIIIFYRAGYEEEFYFHSDIVKDRQRESDPDEWFVCGNKQAHKLLENFFEE